MFKVNSKFIREFIFQRGLSLKEFAEQAGLNQFTAGKIVRDGATVTAKTIGVLARFFNVDGEKLILKS